jgi:pimeloyl-ACP methyl ester carboxylesterase
MHFKSHVRAMASLRLRLTLGAIVDRPEGRSQPKEHNRVSAEASRITTYFRVCDGVRVRYADTRADSDITVLMLAPWPETLWAFRRIWQRVTALGRVVAIDMPGFGHSDQSREELIAPDGSGAFLGRLIEEWGLGAPHVVGPDVGTAAALFLAAQAPERVSSLTIGGGAVRFPIDAGGALKDVIEAPSLDVVRGLDARTNIGYAVQAGAPSESEPEVHEDYVSAYDLGRFAESARFVRHYPKQNPTLRDLLPTISTPTQIVAGRDDDLVPWSNNQYLDDLLPNSEIHPLDAGHFAWEEAADQYGRLIVEWIGGGYRRLASSTAGFKARDAR